MTRSKTHRFDSAFACFPTRWFEKREVAGQNDGSLAYAHMGCIFKDGKVYDDGTMSVSTGEFMT